MTQDLQITQLLFWSLVGIPSLIVLGGVVYAVTRVMPVLLRQMQQLVDNNTQFAKIAEDNAKIAKDNAEGLGTVTAEIKRQTSAIELQTSEIKTQGFDFKSYQSLMNDGMEGHSQRIEANTMAISVLRTNLETMPGLIIGAIKDEIKVGMLLGEFQSLRAEVTRAVFQQQARETGTMRPVVIPTTPPTSPALGAPPDEQET